MAPIVDLAPWARLGLAVALLALFLMWERVAPRRSKDQPGRGRWLGNFGLAAIDALIVRLLAPLGLLGVAVWTQQNGYGLAIDLSTGWRWAAEFLLLDLAIYWQHRSLHLWTPLWRLHRTHHLDTHLDTTSGLRFHPAEIVVSWLFKAALIVGFGISVTGILIFEVALNLFALYSHANIRLPGDRIVRKLLITPAMHQVHHSTRIDEQNSNFSNIFSFWDRLFKSYTSPSKSSDEQLVFGIEDKRRSDRSQGLLTLLKDPLVRD